MLQIHGDMPNKDADSNKQYYHLGLYMMACGVGQIVSDADRRLLLSRMLMMRLVREGTTVETMLRWLSAFGNVTTNISHESDRSWSKRALETTKAEIQRAEVVLAEGK